MFCSSCGTPLSAGATYCAKCGTYTNRPTPSKYMPAGIGRRILDSIIDRLIIGVVLVALDVFLVIFTPIVSPFVLILLNLVLFWSFYAAFEYRFQRTPAKWITGTKVVMKDGSRAPWRNIVGRTFARFIPFEPLSFLLGLHPIGWHDRLSGTVVVPATYGASEVQGIDYARHAGFNEENSAVGVVLVIVGFFGAIAVIGIASSVVLVSLNTARQKGHDAQTRSAISSIQVGIEDYYSTHGGTYSNARDCTSGVFTSVGISSLLGSMYNGAPMCYAEPTSYAVSANLGTAGDTFCADRFGVYENRIASDHGSVATCETPTSSATNALSGSASAGSLPGESAVSDPRFAKTITYTDPTYGFTIDYPSDWEITSDTATPPYSVFFIAPPGLSHGGLRGSVVVNITNDQNGGDMLGIARRFALAVQNEAASTGDQWKILTEERNTFLGLPAYVYTTSKLRTFDGGVTYVTQKSYTILFTKGGLVYDVEYKNGLTDFDDMKDLGMKVLNTLRVR